MVCGTGAGVDHGNGGGRAGLGRGAVGPCGTEGLLQFSVEIV